MTNVSRDLGAVLGNMSKEQSDIKSNISPNEQNANAFIVSQEQVQLSGTLTVTAYFYPEDSFILDHPVYGELDSSVLKLDGGYAETTEGGVSFPVTFPITFVEGSSLDPSVLYTYTY